MRLLNTFKYAAIALSIVACSSDDGDVSESGSGNSTTITNVDFTTAVSGNGTEITVTPSATGATSFEVDFGTDATDDVLATIGVPVSYDYPDETATYTITVTAKATGADNVVQEKAITVTYDIPETDAIGRWVLLHDAGALALGPASDNLTWWSNSGEDVATRACLFDDVYEFKADGSFENILGDNTWLEVWYGTVDSEQCGTPVAPYDGTATATWFHDEAAGTITLTGKGAFLGLAKVSDGNELSGPDQAVESITYSDVTISDDKNTLTVGVNYVTATSENAYWQFIFAREGTAGASINETDSDGDGVIDLNDACPNDHGGGNADGCPDFGAPTSGAPAPTTDASGVIAIFSDTYTGTTVTDWNPGWGQSTVYTLETIDSNNTIKYANLNYQGIVLDYDNPIDLTGKTKVRFSYWTPNADNVAFKIVNTSEPDGNTKEVEVSKTGLTTGEWGVAEFDLTTDFGTVNKTGITQLVFVSSTPQATFYIDDIYFY